MAKPSKPKRIITNRDFEDGKSVEWIEQDDLGVLYWVAADFTIYKNLEVGCRIPVDVESVAEFFARVGRDFDASKLPPNTVNNPYSVNL